MIYAILLFFIVILDQITKIYVAGNDVNITLIEKVLNIKYTTNSGAAFSSGANTTWAQPLFIALTVVILPILYIVFLRLGKDKKWLKTSIIFIIGGTIGNFIERIVFGAVTDFIDVPFFANFNVADIALTVGAIMLIFWFLCLDSDALIPIRKIGKKKNG